MNGITAVFVFCWAILVGFLASRRKRSPFGWFLLSLLISPLFSMAILFSIKNNAKKIKILCPSCGQLVATWDSTCEHCHHPLAKDAVFVENAKKAQSMSPQEVEEKNRIATEGYEAFKAGSSKSENPYRSVVPADETKASYWERGFAVAEREKARGE